MNFKDLENSHKGERCFILGAAPSLSDENLSLLKDENVFITNKAFFAKTLGLPHFNYYVLTDERIYPYDKSSIKEYVGPEVIKFYPESLIKNKHFDESLDNVVTIKKIHSGKNHVGLIKNRIPGSFYEGWGKGASVVVDASLIAFFMGFTKIYLLGVDLFYSKNQQHFYKPEFREKSVDIHKLNIDTTSTTALKVLKNLSDHFKKFDVDFVNLSKGFIFDQYMQTDILENVISNDNL